MAGYQIQSFRRYGFSSMLIHARLYCLVYDSLQHPYIILAKNGPTKTYLLYMYLSSLTEWSHSLAWFERPADNRKVLCSNHNGTTKAFRLWKIAQQMCICSSDSSSFFRRGILWGSCCTKGVGRSFDIVLELRSAILSCLFFGAKIVRIVSGKTTKTDPSHLMFREFPSQKSALKETSGGPLT